MRPGKDGRLYAINPENGYFGVAPGTSEYSNQSALLAMSKNSIFTNVALTPDGDVWWEEKTSKQNTPAGLIDWTGKPWTPDCGRKAAHPNSRYTVPCSQNPVLDPEWENPEGVPISAILFGGRRPTMVPLVSEALDWTNGVFQGSLCSSEMTAAAIGTVGQIRRDPFAMLPFCGYNMAHYFQHWLDVGKALSNPPKIFYVNWFRKKDGKWLWPGFGDNSRVLKWICERCDGESKTIETPLGLCPAPGSLDLDGLDITPEEIRLLTTVDTKTDAEGWKTEVEDCKSYYAKFGDDLPKELQSQLDAWIKRLDLQ
jgi:phosphoenolpyruvate carboxykinase (GTP)